MLPALLYIFNDDHIHYIVIEMVKVFRKFIECDDEAAGDYGYPLARTHFSLTFLWPHFIS